MALCLIGAGFGRTGTRSLKTALEMLRLAPCHHMAEVREHPEDGHFRVAAARGDLPDWDAVFANYGASVDWPSAYFWCEIAAHFADAKVLLSVRLEEDWYRSIYATIYRSLTDPASPPPGLERERRQAIYEIIYNKQFGGQLGDKDAALKVYRDHIAEVQRTIAPERLLTYNVAEGWEPLCAFLDLPVPDEPFPLTNTTKDFQERLAARKRVDEAEQEGD
ncbi:MAG: sulfotransferase family protein [Alphaproteobacteria bacterium]|nr:sulfotransferase family protein [Alphaproteobacteria bacterium]